jgi:hypothetical protein
MREGKMECEKCNAAIDPGEEREHFGQVLCEDCYMKGDNPKQLVTFKSAWIRSML